MQLTKFFMGIAVFLLYANTAESKPFVEELMDKDVRQLHDAPDLPQAEIYILRIFRMWDAVGPEKVINTLKSIREIPKLSLRAKNRIDYLLTLANVRIGRVTEAKQILERRRFINEWVVAGPFGNEGGIGYDTQYAPEKSLLMDSDTAMEGSGQSVYWRQAPKEANYLGYLDFQSLNQPAANSCYFARSMLIADKAAKGILRLGAGGTVKALWNQKLVLHDDKYRMSDPDRLAATISIRKGPNILLVKVCTEERGDFGLFARITDNSFTPIALTPAADQIEALATHVKPAKNPSRLIPQPAEILYRAATSPNRTVDAEAIAAEYLFLTTSQDLNTTEARDMAKAACMESKTADRCLLYAAVALDRNEQRVALSVAQESTPNEMAVLVAFARWEMNGPEPAKALPYIRQIFKIRSDSLEGKILKIDLLSRRGFDKKAFAEIEPLLEKHPNMPGLIDFAALLAEEAGFIQKAQKLKEHALMLNFDDAARHEEAAARSLNLGDITELNSHLHNLQLIAPNSDSTYKLVAKLSEGAQNLKMAETAFKKRLDLAPRNATAWVDWGLFLMRNARKDEGINALKTAAEYRPQDTWLAEYLKHLGPAQSFEDAFIIPETIFLSWRDTDEALKESRFLVDQTAIKVFSSGLSSRFSQQVFEISNREDAKEWRTRYIQFLPDAQQIRILAARVFHKDGSVEKVVRRGTIPVSEPWYRLYYDVAAEAIEFPKLSSGDVVELRYRVDDVATRNIFHDYFGDFAFINGFTPKHFWRYTLIAPGSREFRFNTPTVPGLERSLEKEGDNVVYSFQANQIPSLHKEGDMPGLVEVAQYLHISTYKSWKELGQWYQGLVRHQMIPDARIREQVKTLTRGKKSKLEKIAAIYNWVVTATRYVGLEFGIHGYKPYKAPMVVARGFGDCKDKASLLVTMMKEAGIKAEFVLIRTNDLGILPPEPASLSVFNHAIAYVPEYDLYLDGTAEQHGIFELPFGDQGATAVLLQETGAKFVTTNVVSPDQNTTTVKTTVHLDEQGNADLETTATVKGSAAAPLRKLLEVEATRKTRFEGSLAAIYPGATLKALEVHTIDDLSKPASYTFKATVPAFADTEDNSIEIPVDEGLHLVREFARLPRRAYDLIVGPPKILERTVRFILPKKYTNNEVPPAVQIDTPFGTLKLKIEKNENKLTIHRHFSLKTHRIPPKDYPAFVAFCQEVDAALASHIVFRREK